MSYDTEMKPKAIDMFGREIVAGDYVAYGGETGAKIGLVSEVYLGPEPLFNWPRDYRPAHLKVITLYGVVMNGLGDGWAEAFISDKTVVITYSHRLTKITRESVPEDLALEMEKRAFAVFSKRLEKHLRKTLKGTGL